LFVILPLLSSAPLLLVALIGCAPLVFGLTALLILSLLIEAASVFLRLASPLLFRGALLLRNATLFVARAPLILRLSTLLFSLTFLVKSAAIFLSLVSALLVSVALLFAVLALLLSRLTLLLPALLILTLAFGLPLLVFALSTLLFLGLSFVAAALLLSLPALLTVVLGRRRLLLVLLPSFCPLTLPVFAILRFLSIRNPARARQRHRSNSGHQRQATKVTTFHDYLLEGKAEGKVMSALMAITIPRFRFNRNVLLGGFRSGDPIRYGNSVNRIRQTESQFFSECTSLLRSSLKYLVASRSQRGSVV
jgi:hypothetical protein